jgi:hypothetical protein
MNQQQTTRNQTLQPRRMPAEIKLAGSWVTIDDCLPFDQHVANAKLVGATVVRSLDGLIEFYIK